MNKLNLKHILFLFSSVLILHSCTDDNNPDPNIPGSDRDKFLGNWLCKETVPGTSPVTFTINIQKHGVDDTVYVYNFNNLGSQDYAIWIISGNSITIPQQTIAQVDVGGSGFYTNDEINLTYSSDNDQVTALCTH